MPVLRIDDEVMAELRERAIGFGLVFEPPNATLRRVLGLDASAAPITKLQRFGKVHRRKAVKDTNTGQVYPSEYKAGLAFKDEFPDVDKKYIWFALKRKYPSRFVEVATGSERG